MSDLIVGSPNGLPLNVALGITVQVAQLLERTHASGRVHGQLSPGAVWCTRSGDVWLEWAPYVQPVHRSLPPELRHGEDPSIASDIYALGAFAYELLTGLSVSRAWAKAPLVELQHVASAVHFNTQVPRQIDEIVASALSRDPRLRPRSVATLGRMAELWVPTGSWEGALTALLDEPCLELSLQTLPITCERAGLKVPTPLPAPRPVRPPPKLRVATPMPRFQVRDLARAKARGAQSGLTVFLISMLCTASSLAICLLGHELWVHRAAAAPVEAEAMVAPAPPEAPPSPELVPVEVEIAVQATPPPLAETPKPRLKFHKLKLRHRRG